MFSHLSASFARLCLAVLAGVFGCLASLAQNATIKVVNNDNVQRHQIVEVDFPEIQSKLALNGGESIIVINAAGHEVPYQITSDDKLLIEVSVRPSGTAEFTVAKGVPAPMDTFATGKVYPGRLDDLAWENDRTIYRLYGPALQRHNGNAFGIDVWVKNVPTPQADLRYEMHLAHQEIVDAYRKAGRHDLVRAVEDSLSYHVDHGSGMDCYAVGPTLGAGAPGVVVDDELYFPYCYESYRILDNGPLRFSVELTYAPAHKGSLKDVVEHRALSCDKATNFSKMTVWYDALSSPVKVAPGIVVHSSDTLSVELAPDYVIYADPTDNPSVNNSQIYLGLIFPEGVEATEMRPMKGVKGVSGHLLGLKELSSNEPFTYYIGSAWSNYDVTSFAEWRLRTVDALFALTHPLSVSVE